MLLFSKHIETVYSLGGGLFETLVFKQEALFTLMKESRAVMTPVIHIFIKEINPTSAKRRNRNVLQP